MPKNASVTELTFAYSEATVFSNSVFTDDPLFSQSALCTIPVGSTVSYLATMGDWVYVEWTGTGKFKLTRGFVKETSIIMVTKEEAISLARKHFLSSDPIVDDGYITEATLDQYSISAEYSQDASAWVVRIDSLGDYYWLIEVNVSDRSIIRMDSLIK